MKQLFHIHEKSVRKARVYGIWTKTAPPPSFLPDQQGWLHSRMLQPRTQGSLLPQFRARGLSSCRSRTSALLIFSQLPVAEEAVMGKRGTEVEAPYLHPASTHGMKALPWAWCAENTGAPKALLLAHEAVVPGQESQAKRPQATVPVSTRGPCS